MGIFISDGQSSVLIDGLHTKYGEDYLFPTPELVSNIKNNLKPDAILFTHNHGDHFSPELSLDYMISNTEAVLFGPNQVTDNFTEFGDRISSISTKDYTKQSGNVGNIKIKALKINHAGKRHIAKQNVGYIVTINDKNILHVGDTNWLEEINLFEQLDLQKESINIAILPYWMLIQDDAPLLIKRYINPETVIATHISPRIKEKELSTLKNRYPKTYFLTELKQRIQL